MNSLSSKLASLLSDVQRSEQKTRERAELAEKEGLDNLCVYLIPR